MAYYKKNASADLAEANWNERTCVRRQGGFLVDKNSLPDGMKVLPKGAVMCAKSDGKAAFVKTAVASAAVASAATFVKLVKGHGFKVGDTVNGSAISAISTTAQNYDTLTVAALTAGIEEGGIVCSSFGDGILGLNYAPVVIDDVPTCTVTLQAYEIDESTLPYKINAAVKEGLTSRHSFISVPPSATTD